MTKRERKQLKIDQRLPEICAQYQAMNVPVNGNEKFVLRRKIALCPMIPHPLKVHTYFLSLHGYLQPPDLRYQGQHVSKRDGTGAQKCISVSPFSTRE